MKEVMRDEIEWLVDGGRMCAVQQFLSVLKHM